MALIPLPSIIGRDLNPRPTDRYIRALHLPLDHSFYFISKVNPQLFLLQSIICSNVSNVSLLTVNQTLKEMFNNLTVIVNFFGN
jgi:hypothetical protein